jgi:Flp pilus assembly protein CpaB
MKSRSNLFIIIGGAIVVGLLVLFSLRAATSTTPTVIAARSIAAGTRLTAADLTTQPLNTNSRLSGALAKPEEAIGQVSLIARAPGDQLTTDLISDQAGVGIPAHLEPGTVALGVHVSQSSGLAGAIREGDHVTAIAIVDPQNLGTLTLATTGALPGTPEPDATPLPTPKPQTAAARLTITGLKVLLVPQSFRYEEVPQDKTGDLSPVRSSVGNQQNSVILLQAPLDPIEVAPGQWMSPAELLALLDEKAAIHLALEPREGVTTAINATGVQLADVYALLIGNVPVTPTPAMMLPSAPLTATVPVTSQVAP